MKTAAKTKPKRKKNKFPKVKRRPTHCTPELITKIAAVIEAGASPRSSALSLGVNPASWSEWLQKGEAGIAPYSALVSAIHEAENKSFQRAEKQLGKLIGKADIKAVTWFLERRYRQIYKPVTHTEVSGPNASPVALQHLSSADLLKLASEDDDNDD